MQQPKAWCSCHFILNGGTRESTRDYIRATLAACGGNLNVELHALATRVLFDGKRAVGVEYLSGENLYRASPAPTSSEGERRELRVKREVILCGGVFNTPQLLMLSGIGPAAELRAHGIESRVDLQGVGKNLQDRYEMSVVYELDGELDAQRDMNLTAPDPSAPDPALARWWFDRNGPYATNGVVGALVQKSKPSLATPDLFVFGIVGNFHGYFPGYSRELSADKSIFVGRAQSAHDEPRRRRAPSIERPARSAAS